MVAGTGRAEDDQDLVARAKQGDREAFGELVLRHEGAMLAIARAYFASEADAEDAVQEAFVKAYRRLEQLASDSRFAAWVARITRNLCIDELRKRKVRRHSPLDARGPEGEGRALVEKLANGGPPTDAPAMDHELRERIEHAIAQIPDKQREVFVLREFSHLSFAEVATTVGCSENTAKSRMRYALERLRVLLADLQPEES